MIRLSSSVCLLLVAIVGCGAKSDLSLDPLSEPPVVDAGPDATVDTRPAEELCDSLDNDGDGRVDETLPTITCGTGDCMVQTCADRCIPSPPRVEVCGGGDEDCDGSIDEGMRTVASAVVEVRDGAGGYDRCDTCSWATSVHVVEHGAGAFVFWRHGIYGGDEIPNVWGREYDANMQPLGPPRLLSDSVVLLSIERIPGLYEDEGLFLAVRRVPGLARDPYVFVRITPSGVEVIDFPDTEEHCSTARRVVYVDGRVAAACLTREDARLWSFSVGGEVTRTRLMVDDMFYGGTLHVRDSKLYLFGIHVLIPRELWSMSTTVLSPTLDVISPLRLTDTSYARFPLVFPKPTGFVYWNTDVRESTTYEVLNENAQPTAAPVPYDFRINISNTSAVWRPDQVSARHPAIFFDGFDERYDTRFAFVTEDGTLENEIDIALPLTPLGEEDFATYFDLTRFGGRFWAAFVGASGDGTPNNVSMMQFTCEVP